MIDTAACKSYLVNRILADYLLGGEESQIIKDMIDWGFSIAEAEEMIDLVCDEKYWKREKKFKDLTGNKTVRTFYPTLEGCPISFVEVVEQDGQILEDEFYWEID
jgi:hypothetical protein